MSEPHTDLEKHASSEGTSLHDGHEKPFHETPFDAAADAEANEAAAPTGPAPASFANVPDGGLLAWSQVAGSFFLFFNTWGIMNTFGAYQTYYESGDLFVSTSSDIAWIGTIQAICVMLFGALSGPLYDQGHLRPLLLVGSILVVLGNMMLSLCHEFWQCLLAQGFCIGIGAGCLFVPAVAILPTYFRKNLGLAIGLAASGSSMGGVIYPIVLYRLINTIGFGWSTRVLGFIALATLLLPIIVMKQRIKPPKARALLDPTAFTDLPFAVYVGGLIFGFVGLYTGLFFTSYFSAATGIADEEMAFYLVPILNAASVFGRTLPNWLSDKVGPLNIMTPGAFICSILLFCFLAVHNLAGMIVNTIFFGFFSGVFIALPAVLLVVLTADKTKAGTRIGMGFGFLSIGALLGGPAAGAIIGEDPTNLHFQSMWIYGAVFMLASGLVFVYVRWLKVGFKLMVKI
ncbi:hypothetical protein AMS68_002285 [Peltaster fructicola]|uniref:Major facilitator superfamily (MFS) profile domain-containing protein n=1 Tax=Peltaster fructicola TaxID=286661 RepID=A0A6H0XQ53_9PEZI|nr:hypothetical protein AMS68_002285 [Peltaster fructicola]